jgi:RNA polymerase primary sigma factor
MGRQPTPTEIAVDIEMSEARVSELLEIDLSESSMEAPIGVDGSLSLGEVLPCPTDIEEEVLTEGSQADLNRLLDEILTDRENIIVRLYFGLCGAPEHALTDIGYYLDISRERVRQLLQRALAKLRANLSPEMFGFALAVSPEDQS